MNIASRVPTPPSVMGKRPMSVATGQQGAGVEEVDVGAHRAEQCEHDDEGEPANDQRKGARGRQAAGGREERVEGVEEVFDLPCVR